MAEETTDTKTPDLAAEHAVRQTEILDKLAEETRLTRELLAKRVDPEAKPEPVYTKEQLQAWIDEGKVSVLDAATYLAEQGMKRTAASLRNENSQTLAAERAVAAVDQKISAYKDKIPALLDTGSEEFKLVQSVYKELIEDGHDESTTEAKLRTQLAALKIAFPKGDEKPREITSRKVTTESAGSSGGRATTGGKKASGNKWPEYVSQDMRDLKERQIEAGMYKGMDDPRLVQELAILKRRAEKKERAA